MPKISPFEKYAAIRKIDLAFNQTIFKSLSGTTRDEPIKSGHGEGSFVVIRGRKEEVETVEVQV